MAYSIGPRRSVLVLGALLTVGCGNGDDLDPATELEPAMQATGPAEDEEEEDLVSAPVAPPSAPPETEDTETTEMPPEVAENGEGAPCRTPLGVSGAPQTLPEAVVLMNSLPRPTTLECFLQSLDRPLSIYATSSALSLQPSPSARSPRTFIVNGPLVMSIVFEGEADETLELGYRTADDRSIKTEILFPIERDITLGGLFDRVVTGPSTMCGACHTGEIQMDFEDFPDGVFESTVIAPANFYEVRLDELMAEEAGCDPQREPKRCGLLDAMFDYGDVRQSPLWLDTPL